LANQNQVRTSSDGGVTWNAFKSTISGANHVTDMVDDGAKLVLFNYSQTAPVMTSTDGYNWSAPAISITWANANNPYSAAYGNGLYMMVTNSRYIYTSTDLVNWQTNVHPVNTGLQTVTYGNGQFILTTNGGGYYVYYY